MSDEEFAAAAVAHCEGQVAAAREAAERAAEKVGKFQELADAAAVQAQEAQLAVERAEAELADWQAKAGGTAAAEASESVSADAGVAEGTGEAGL